MTHVSNFVSALTQSGQDGGMWLPHGASTYTEAIDRLWFIIFYVVIAMFILVEGLIVVFCIMYRRRPGHRPAYTHGSRTAEITWTIIPGLMLLGLAIWQIPTWNHVKRDFPPPGKGVTEVRVMGEQYKWNFLYPGTKAQFKGDHDYSNLSLLNVPFGDKVLLHLRSKDVIHSIFIPHMRVKQDTVPGLRQRTWFEPSRFQLIDLRAPVLQEGSYWDKKARNGAGESKPRMVQPVVWASAAADFEPGGRFFDKRIAVSALSDYSQDNGLYKVFTPQGQAKRVRVLHQGKVMTGQEWASCDFALGIFEIACAELCGMGHYTMRAFLVVHPRASYDWWIKEESENADKPAPIWNLWKD